MQRTLAQCGFAKRVRRASPKPNPQRRKYVICGVRPIAIEDNDSRCFRDCQLTLDSYFVRRGRRYRQRSIKNYFFQTNVNTHHRQLVLIAIPRWTFPASAASVFIAMACAPR